MLDVIEQRLRSWFLRYQSVLADSRLRRAGWALAVILFAVIAAVAVVNLPRIPILRIGPVIGAVALTSAILLLTVYEVLLIGSIAAVDLSFRTASKIVILGSLANLAPAPGAVSVRVGALVARGGSLRQGVTANLFVGGYWVGLALMIGGISIMTVTGRGLWATACLIAGVAALAGATLLMRSPTVSPITWAQTAAVEVSMILLSGLVIGSTLLAVGFQASLAQTLVITMSSVVATAIGFFPMGLGLAEVFAGATALLVALNPSVAIVGTVGARVVSLLTLALAAAIQHIAEGTDRPRA